MTRPLEGIRVVERADGEVLFEADEAAAQRVLTDALARGPVAEFSPVRPSLAEIFREVIRDEAPATAVAA